MADPFARIRFIREVLFTPPEGTEAEEYPFSLPCLRNLRSLNIHPHVTFLVGENGCGKSTLIEAIAVEWGMNAEGGGRNFTFSTRPSHSCLDRHIKLVKGIQHPDTNFFLRAETFYNVATNIDDLGAIASYGGVSLHQQSHGESFLALVEHRFWPKGLYILDEPESALSPKGQLRFLARLHELVEKGSQFIIATHSPLIMAYPDAWIYQIDDDGPKRVEYEETEHYRITRGFLTAPAKRMAEVTGASAPPLPTALASPLRGTTFIRELRYEPPEGEARGEYPYCLPCLHDLDTLQFHPRVTYLVGENGSGKSTLVEAIAVAWGMNAEGGGRHFTVATRATHSPLHERIKLLKGINRPRTSYFLRAESFYNVASDIDRMDEEHQALHESHKAVSLGQPLIEAYGGVSLHQQSHGESFLALMQHRFRPKGLYVLDEPEAALSPNGELRFLARMHQLVEQGCQFIISTHSPTIMAYPDAWIYQIGRNGPKRVAYEETANYRITRAFLAAPQRRLREILQPDA